MPALESSNSKLLKKKKRGTKAKDSFNDICYFGYTRCYISVAFLVQRERPLDKSMTKERKF